MICHHFSQPNDLKMFNIPSGVQQPHKIPCKRCVFHPKFPLVNVIKFILILLLMRSFQAQKQQHRINLLYIYYVILFYKKYSNTTRNISKKKNI